MSLYNIHSNKKALSHYSLGLFKSSKTILVYIKTNKSVYLFVIVNLIHEKKKLKSSKFKPFIATYFRIYKINQASLNLYLTPHFHYSVSWYLEEITSRTRIKLHRNEQFFTP